MLESRTLLSIDTSIPAPSLVNAGDGPTIHWDPYASNGNADDGFTARVIFKPDPSTDPYQLNWKWEDFWSSNTTVDGSMYTDDNNYQVGGESLPTADYLVNVQVQGYDDEGESPWSGFGSFHSTNGGYGILPTPTGFTASNNGNTTTLNWSVSGGSNGFQYYAFSVFGIVDSGGAVQIPASNSLGYGSGSATVANSNIPHNVHQLFIVSDTSYAVTQGFGYSLYSNYASVSWGTGANAVGGYGSDGQGGDDNGNGGGGGGGGQDPPPAGVSLTAYRTGNNFGQAVSSTVQQGGDPSQYVNLVDDNFDIQGVGGTADDQLTTCKTDGSDPDVIQITLNGISAGQNSASVGLSISDPYGGGYQDDIGEWIYSGLKLFKSDGTELHQADLSASTTSNTNSYLAPLLTGGSVTIWCEAIYAYSDMSVSLDYNGGSANGPSTASVQMDNVDFLFSGTDGSQMVAAAPVWKDALLAAATDPSGPWVDPINTGNPSSDSFFRAYLSGLTSNFSGTLQIQSDDDPSDSYAEQVTPNGSGYYLQQKFGVLYNGDMIYAPSGDDAALTSTEQSEIENNLMLYALHNPGATATLTTNFDVQSREIANLRHADITVNNDLFGTTANNLLTGTATINEPNPNNVVRFDIQLSLNGQLVSNVDSQTGNFQFTFNNAGLYSIDVVGIDVGLVPGTLSVKITEDSFAVLVNDSVRVNSYATAAWDALRTTANQPGTVPGDVVERNRLITSHYADMYNSNKAFLWAGMAAFTSAEVGNSLASAALGGLAAGVPLLGKLVGDRQTIMQGYYYFAQGNFMIYMDIYPTFLAYNDPNGGFNAINMMGPPNQQNNGQGTNYIAPDLVAAWKGFNDAFNAGNHTDWQTVIDFVNHEQNTELQPVIFTPNANFWTNDFSPHFAKYATSLIPGTSPFLTIVPNGNLESATDRLAWFNSPNTPTCLLSSFETWIGNNLTTNIDVTVLYAGGYQ